MATTNHPPVYSHGDTGVPAAHDPVQDVQHGDDTSKFGKRFGLDKQRNDDYFIHDGHAPTAADAPSNELHGHASQQEQIDAYRAKMDDHATRGEMGHPQDRTAAADQYAHASRETGGKPYKRGG